MGKWILAASLKQRTHSCITSHAEFFSETSNHPGDSARFGTLWRLAFLKTKITFEREEISDYGWDSGKYNRAADGNWENCVRSQGTYLEGDRGVIFLCTFLVSYIFFNKCLYFSYYMAGYLLDRPYLYIYLLNLILWHLSIDQIACKYHYMKLSTRYMQSFLLWLEKLP